MKSWQRYTICLALGLVAGAGYAMQQLRSGMADDGIQIGAWTTGKSYGSADATALTRARVALSGLLALPAKEAMYFTAKVASDGSALDGRCTYIVSGGKLEGRWWSVTLYQGDGWLVKNAANRWSIPAHAANQGEGGRWSFTVSPDMHPGAWLPTGGVRAFDMTLRLYHPSPSLVAYPAKASLPSIRRVKCL
ncbi:MAG: DUF1214 domain-containing protein [Sphingorhabdus sp.]